MSVSAIPLNPVKAGAGPQDGSTSGRLLRIGCSYLLSAVLVIPIYWLLVTSLRQPAELQSATTFWPASPNLVGYADVLTDPGFGRNLINSLIYGLGGVALGVVCGAGIGYAVARSSSRWGRYVMFAMLVLQTFPNIMLALPLFILFSQFGMINNPLSVICAIGTKTIPFTALMMRPQFAAIPLSVEQAASLDGCSRMGVFGRVVLPLVLPGLATVSAFNFVTGWGDLMFSFTLLTEANLQPVSVGLYKYMGLYAVDWNQLMAAALIASIPSIIVFFTSQKFLVAGSASGATNE